MYDEAEDFREHRSEIDAFVAILARVDIRLSRDALVLDAGGGQGMHVGFLSGLAGRVYCADVIDYSSLYGGEFLKLLAEKHRRHGVEFHLDRVAFHQTDATNLFYRDALFDAVVSINSFEHIGNPGKALDEMIRVTRPGGCIYVSTDPIWTADTGSHFFHRVREPWAHLLCGNDEFMARMRADGASESEAREYETAMNRWREKDYRAIVDAATARGSVTVLHHDGWSGVADDSHLGHPNLRLLQQRGYAESELMLRGLRWVFRRG
ncbi:MAG TPA: class I SAM-dependent methyltransferase [Casimicrobiaceae bacterium]|nr:class I SAM-dependent methyltransferase [Casimicrobiaceae bacterium]